MPTVARLNIDITSRFRIVQNALSRGTAWPINGDRFYGRTPEEARDKLIKAAQTYFDNEYTNLTVTEVELAPRTVDRWGRTL